MARHVYFTSNEREIVCEASLSRRCHTYQFLVPEVVRCQLLGGKHTACVAMYVRHPVEVKTVQCAAVNTTTPQWQELEHACKAIVNIDGAIADYDMYKFMYIASFLIALIMFAAFFLNPSSSSRIRR